MQKIDFFVGVPATFCCSLYLKIKRLFVPVRKPAHAPRNILCIELSEMGSMVQLTPLIALMQKTYPDAAIYFVTFRSSAPILHLMNMIDRGKILTLRSGNFVHFVTDFFRLIFTLGKIPFDITLDFELFSRVSSLISFFSGAPVKIGFDNFKGEGLYRGSFLTHPVLYNHHHHIAKNFLGMWYALEEPLNEIPHTKRRVEDDEIRLPPIDFKHDDIEIFRERLYAAYPVIKTTPLLVLLNPNSSVQLPLRRWPLLSYLSLTERLLTLGAVTVAVTGGPDEREDAAFLTSRLPHPRLIDISGFTTMPELISLYHIADLMISNDSGPAQFAALAKMKTITLFGPETSDLYGPLNPNGVNIQKKLQCSPCYTAQNHRRSACQNNVCMQLITVDEIYDASLQMLGIRPAA